jgi:hypothetical protein
MRCLPALSFLALLASHALLACNPAIVAHDTADPSSPDDAGALYPWYTGNDGAGDDADPTIDPSQDGGPMSPDAAAVSAGPDAGASPAPADASDAPYDGGCSQPLQAGDLVIDELMVESVAGAGDDGEWLEIASTLACATNLRGLHAECPVGSEVHTLDVSDDVWVPAGGTFIIADSVDPAINHYLPGLVLSWSGHAGDVLRNLGGTVTLSVGQEIVVSLTWPSRKWAVGTSLELPADCPPGDGGTFTDWQQAIASWFPAFHGTPNAANLDVACP